MGSLLEKSVDDRRLRFNRFGREARQLELSIVMPCLNEADTVAACVTVAKNALAEHQINGEVIVADNGSSDGSQAIASDLGARVINVPQRGYGAALMGGIAASRGRFILMGDADQSYDFAEAPRFLEKLREGFDLVQGCRLPAGGGRVEPGAMPFLHRCLGNPGLTFLAQWWFHAGIDDVYCGMRAFTREFYDSINQRCTGMEFATEMIIKASRHGSRVAQVPITLHRDGRTSHPPHLKTFRDGWRTLRFFLMYAPRWLFLEPGKLLTVLGLLAAILALSGLTIAHHSLGANALVLGGIMMLCGSQAVLFAVGTKTFAVLQNLCPPDERLERFFKRFTLERGLMLGGAAIGIGVALAVAFGIATRTALSERCFLLGVGVAAWGFQTILFSFFISIIGLSQTLRPVDKAVPAERKAI